MKLMASSVTWSGVVYLSAAATIAAVADPCFVSESFSNSP